MCHSQTPQFPILHPLHIFLIYITTGLQSTDFESHEMPPNSISILPNSPTSLGFIFFNFLKIFYPLNQHTCIGVWMNVLNPSPRWSQSEGGMYKRKALWKRNVKEVEWDGGEGVGDVTRSPPFLSPCMHACIHSFLCSFWKQGKGSGLLFVLTVTPSWPPGGAWVNHKLLNKSPLEPLMEYLEQFCEQLSCKSVQRLRTSVFVSFDQKLTFESTVHFLSISRQLLL